MKRYSPLREDSFKPEDIPKYFYLCFDSYNLDPSELLAQTLKGIKGISDTELIIKNWFTAGRDMILIMDGKKLVEVNKLSKAMYDNPDYLVSNNMKVLFRLWAQRDSMGLFQNFDGYFIGAGKKQTYAQDLCYEMERCGYGGHAWPYWYDKKPPKIKNFAQFCKWLYDVTCHGVEGSDKYWADPKDWNYYPTYKKVNDLCQKITLKQFSDICKEALLRIGKVYSDEGEWFIKNETLKIPDKSNIVMAVDEGSKYFEDMRAGKLPDSYDEWNKAQETPSLMMSDHGYKNFLKLQNIYHALKGIYRVQFADITKFNNLREKLFNSTDIQGQIEQLKQFFNISEQSMKRYKPLQERIMPEYKAWYSPSSDKFIQFSTNSLHGDLAEKYFKMDEVEAIRKGYIRISVLKGLNIESWNKPDDRTFLAVQDRLNSNTSKGQPQTYWEILETGKYKIFPKDSFFYAPSFNDKKK